MSYNKCECGNSGEISVNLMNRGGRNAVMCRACYERLSGHGGKVIPRPANDSAPVLKDVTNSYSLLIHNVTPSVLAELARHGCDVSKVAANNPRVYFPLKTRLNSAIRYAESLRKLSEREGVQWSSFRLTLSSASANYSRTYAFEGSVEDWPNFIRKAEDSFCKRIGCPQWSALKTGTRKNG